jgi:predicted restriction endonuclease
MARPEVKEAHRQKARENAARLKNNDEFRIKISLSQGGDGDLSRMNSDRTRGDSLWRKHVKERDNYMCQVCGCRDNLHAHHIKPKSSFPGLRHDLANGITLCRSCHLEEHRSMKNNNGITRTGLLALLEG